MAGKEVFGTGGVGDNSAEPNSATRRGCWAARECKSTPSDQVYSKKRYRPARFEKIAGGSLFRVFPEVSYPLRGTEIRCSRRTRGCGWHYRGHLQVGSVFPGGGGKDTRCKTSMMNRKFKMTANAESRVFRHPHRGMERTGSNAFGSCRPWIC